MSKAFENAHVFSNYANPLEKYLIKCHLSDKIDNFLVSAANFYIQNQNFTDVKFI